MVKKDHIGLILLKYCNFTNKRRTLVLLMLSLFSCTIIGNVSDSLQSAFNSQTGMQQIETGIGLCYELSDEPEKMLQTSLSLIGKVNISKTDPLVTARIYRAIADAYYYCNQLGNSNEYLLKAISMAESNDGNLAFLAEAHNDLGLNYRNIDENEKALEHLNKAVEINRSLNRPDMLADAISNQAAVYHAMGQFEKAINLFTQAYEIDRSTGNVKSQATSLNNLGRMYVDWGKYETGIEFYRRSLALLDTIADRKLLGVRYNNIGLAYQLMGKHTDAIQWLKKAMVYDMEQSNELNIAKRQFNLGTSYLSLNDFGNSKKYLEQAERFFTGLNLPSYLTNVYGKLGELHQKQHDFSGAESYYLKSAEMAERANTFPAKAFASKYLYNYYKTTSQPARALKYLEIFTNSNDSVYKVETAKQIAELEKKYQTEKKENEIQRLEVENKMRSKELIYRKRERNLAFAGLLLLFIFSTSIYCLFRRVKAQKTTLSKQNDELERLNKTLNHLFGIISHDLRNATAAYQSSAKIISHHLHAGNPEKLLPLAPEIGKNAHQLSVMLENLLNWSVLQIKGVQPEKTTIRIKDEIEKIVLLYSEQLKSKNNQIQVEMSNEQIWCDPESFNLVIRNLVHNAIKFTSQGEIILKASSNNGATTIMVKDTGCGMDSDMIRNLRQKIPVNAKPAHPAEKGTGLGLLMVAEHIEKNSGTFQIDSSQGKGTCIYITFPNHKP